MKTICHFAATTLSCLLSIASVSLCASSEAASANAIDANGNQLPAKTDATNATEKDKPSLLTDISNYLMLRKSFLTAEDKDEPAKFSWTKSEGEPSFYEFDLALGLNPKGFPFLHSGRSTESWDFNRKIQPTFEAHTSTQQKAEQDSLSARLPVTLYLQPNFDTFVSQHLLAISFVYETDRHQDTSTIGGDVYYTPTIPSLAAGIEQTAGALAFRWRPFIGFEGGHILENDKGALDPSENEFCRFVLKLHADLWIGKQFALAADYSLRTELTGNQSTHGYFEVSPIVYLDKDHHFSAGLTYKRGKTTPDFSDVDSVNVWMGVLF